MQIIKIRKLTALLLTLVMAVSVFATAAFADIWADDAVSKLTAGFADDVVEQYPELAELTTTVHLYKVADLGSDGKLSPVAAYADIEGLGDITRESEAEQVDAVLGLLTAAVEEAQPEEDFSFEVANKSGSLEGIPNGVYLGLTDEFSSYEYKYNVAPMLLMFPWEVSIVNGESHYETDVSVTLKVERSAALGDLLIKKTLRILRANLDATFVFNVVGYYKDNLVIDRIVTFHFDKPGTQQVLIEDLPVGTQVTVTESYSGGYITQGAREQTGIIVANTRPYSQYLENPSNDPDVIPPLTFEFLNVPGGNFPGQAIENVYSYKEGYGYQFERQVFYYGH